MKDPLEKLEELEKHGTPYLVLYSIRNPLHPHAGNVSKVIYADSPEKAKTLAEQLLGDEYDRILSIMSIGK